MRKIIAGVVLVVFVFTAAYFSSCKGKDSTTTSSNEDSLKAVVARGDYLAHNVSQCLDCHSIRDTGRFSMPVIPGTEGGGSGFPFGKEEGVPGTVFPPNITPFSLKDASDEDILKTITTGINKKGDTLFPIMPYHSFSRMTKSDLLSIIAYIRTLKPIERKVPARQLDIPMSMMGPILQPNLDNNVMPDPSDKVKYGQYMINAALCDQCHTPMGQQGPDLSKMYAGGFTFKLPMFTVTVANITPDSATGIGAWTEEMFLAKFKQNSSDEMVNRNPGKENTIMPWAAYGKMKEDDLKAIYAYLRTVKPVSNKVEKWPK
ncbi:MAG TPA: c-type cytochrome [Chitinophagaceae bacterium]|nr:c-type cytochrome [Chitinophagaceae bacterium]